MDVPTKRASEWVGASVVTLERHYAHIIPTDIEPPSLVRGVGISSEATQVRGITGDPGRIRTCDPVLRRHVLYPAELPGQWWGVLDSNQ